MSAAYVEFVRAGERAAARYALGTLRRTPHGRAGEHLGARTGSALEFEEHRDYHAGDDLRHVNWSIFARSDQLAVKLFHEEVAPYFDLLLDTSRSMALPGSAKERAAVGLAALLSTAAVNAGFAERLWVSGAACEPLPTGVDRDAAWARLEFDARLSLAEAVARRPPTWRPRSVRAIVSDLFWEGDPLRFLAPCAEGATSLIVISLLAQADVAPAEDGNLRLIDCETGAMQEILVDALARRRYAEALAQHHDIWQGACRQVGALFVPLVAEELVRDWRLEALLHAEFLVVI